MGDVAEMKQRIRIISDVPLLVLAIVSTSAMALACGIVIWNIQDVAADPSEVIPIQVIFAVLFIVFFGASVSSISRSICVITLTKNAILLKIPFQKGGFSNMRSTRMVKSVGYRESITTGGKFILGSINAQILTRIR